MPPSQPNPTLCASAHLAATLWQHACQTDGTCSGTLGSPDHLATMRMRYIVLQPTVHRWLVQDARAFVQSLQYWLGGNAANLEGLLLNTAQRYVPALKGMDFAVAEPQLFPDVGIWHPLAPSAPPCSSPRLSAYTVSDDGKELIHSMPCEHIRLWAVLVKIKFTAPAVLRCALSRCAAMYDDVKEYLNWYDTRSDLRLPDGAPIVGLVLQRSHLVTGDEGHYSGVVSEMEARGAKARPGPLRATAILEPAACLPCARVRVYTPQILGPAMCLRVEPDLKRCHCNFVTSLTLKYCRPKFVRLLEACR